MSVLASVHPSAIVARDAELGEGCTIGPFAVVEAGVWVGEHAVIQTGSVLHTGSRIGARCQVGPYAVVGGEPMDTAFCGEPSFTVLEENVTLREFVSVHRSSGEGSETRIGSDTLVMSSVHVSHNVQVGRSCVLTTQVQLGGHAEVGDYAVLGSAARVHQHCRIGTCAMFGAGAAANRDVLPYSMARGDPARHYRLNRIGLERRGVDGERYRNLERAVRAFRRRDGALLEELALISKDVKMMLTFQASAKRGLSAFV